MRERQRSSSGGRRTGAARAPAVRSETEDLLEISEALHKLCQPLTALHCRLEIGELHGTPEAYREAIREGLRECGRLLQGVGAMREVVRSVLEARSIEHE